MKVDETNTILALCVVLEVARQLRKVLLSQCCVLQEDWVAVARAERETTLASLEIPHS